MKNMELPEKNQERGGWCIVHNVVRPSEDQIYPCRPQLFSIRQLEPLVVGLIYLPLWRDDEWVLFPNNLALIDGFFRDQAFSFRLVKVSYFYLVAEEGDIKLIIDSGRWPYFAGACSATRK